MTKDIRSLFCSDRFKYKAYIHVEHGGEFFVMIEDVSGLFALHHPGKKIPQNALAHNCMISHASISQGAGIY